MKIATSIALCADPDLEGLFNLTRGEAAVKECIEKKGYVEWLRYPFSVPHGLAAGMAMYYTSKYGLVIEAEIPSAQYKSIVSAGVYTHD